jgi:hypothetical protein
MKRILLILTLLALLLAAGCAAPAASTPPARDPAASPTATTASESAGSPATTATTPPTAPAATAAGPASQPAAGPQLKVGDGSTTQTFSAEQLQALGASQADFREVTYTGVPLADLIRAAGFDPGAIKAVKAIASDGFSVNYEPALVNLPTTLVAYARAAGPLADDELPFRMVLPDQEGKLNPRQLVELRIIP